MSPLCQAHAAESGGLPLAGTHCRLEPGDRLLSAGMPFTSIYAVCAGFLQVTAPDGAGGRHIVRLLLPGDAAGLDGFAGGIHHGETVALEDCEVCPIPASRASSIADRDGRVAAYLRTLLAQELVEARSHAAAVARLTARQRVASLILALSRRWAERGFSGSAFRLPMGRREIGEHLGLTMETVSRILSDFKSRGWIRLPRRGIEIACPDMLAQVLESTRPPPFSQTTHSRD